MRISPFRSCGPNNRRKNIQTFQLEMIATPGAFDNAVSTIRHCSAGSTYGAAGSLVTVVVWIYYSAQIFFFGAEFTRVYSDSRKGKSEPGGAGRLAAAARGSSAKN
jgi:hypothetical protein